MRQSCVGYAHTEQQSVDIIAVQLDQPLRFGHVTVLAGGHQALHMFLQVDLPMNLDLLWHIKLCQAVPT